MGQETNGGMSPPYPRFDLLRSIGQIEKAPALRSRSLDLAGVMAALGYKTISGSSKDAIGTKRQYGPLVREDGSFRVRAVAERILNAASHHDADAAFQAAMFAPPVFALLRETFGDAPPSLDEARSFLIERGFRPNAATTAVGLARPQP